MAAAAAAAAEIERKHTHYRTQAATQLTSSILLIKSLKEVQFHKFNQQLKRAAYSNEWHASLLDASVAPPALNDAERTTKLECDERNFYQILMAKTDDTAVCHSLVDIKIGDGRAVWLAIQNYYLRKTTAGRSTATKRFHNATMASTNTNVDEFGALITRYAKELVQVGGQADESAQICQLLDGLLDDFKPIRNILLMTPTLPLADIKAKLNDFAQENDLLVKKITGPRQAKVFGMDTSAASRPVYQNRQKPLDNRPSKPAPPPGVDPTQQCLNWTRGKCRFGIKCFRQHDGPGGSLPGAPGHVPTPSAHFTGVPPCHYCGVAGHFMIACDAYKLAIPSAQSHIAPTNSSSAADPTNDHSAYTFLIEELPESEENYPCVADTSAGTLLPSFFAASICAVIASISCLFGLAQLFFASRSNHPFLFWGGSVAIGIAAYSLCGQSSVSTTRPPRPGIGGGYNIFILTAATLAILYLASTALSLPGVSGASVPSSVYHNSAKRVSAPEDYPFISDSGANRFVTNDANDFVPDSVRWIETDVAVGGGNVTSPCTGTMRVRSIDYDHIIECKDTLLLPTCAKKLMPAFQFVAKGCELKYKSDTVTLIDQENHPVLCGKEFGGLYYFHCESVRNWPDVAHSLPPDMQSAALFGLPVSKNISAKSVDFSRKLLEAHWCYGHMHFDKLRKLFGLGKGSNPNCTVCTVAKQKQLALSDHAHTRSDRPCHRMHMDVGYTAGRKYVFQLYVDDYHRVSYLDMLDSKAQVLPKWIALKDRLENDSQPWKFAFVKSDSEPIYFTPDWEQYCQVSGVTHESSNPYLHGQNGVVERCMQTVGVGFRCFMITGNAPERMTPHALRFSNVIRNASPTKANNGMTPLEKQAGKKLPINQRLLQGPLFCLVFAHVYEVQRVKHAARGVACVYLGYYPDDNTYLVMDWRSGEEYYTSSLDFHPNILPFRANPERIIGTINRWDDLAPHITDIIEPGDAAEQRTSIRQRGYASSATRPLVISLTSMFLPTLLRTSQQRLGNWDILATSPNMKCLPSTDPIPTPWKRPSGFLIATNGSLPNSVRKSPSNTTTCARLCPDLSPQVGASESSKPDQSSSTSTTQMAPSSSASTDSLLLPSQKCLKKE